MTPNNYLYQNTALGSTLSDLLKVLGENASLRKGESNVRVFDACQDSRRVKSGSLFVARRGTAHNPLDFATAAIAAGATAIWADEELVDSAFVESCSVPVVTSQNVRARLSEVAELIYGHPSRKISIIGLTGTNGKTTTALLIEQALISAGKKPGRLGTVGSSFDGVENESNLTTPEADDLTRFFAHVVAHGGSHVVMEVSSHALSQGRVAGVRFDTAAFTNLTQDHLDFHETMAEYEAAKLLLFTQFEPRVSVINVINEAGNRFAATARSSRILRVGLGDGCDVRPVDVTLDAQGLRGGVLVAGRYYDVKTRLVGEHNLENILVSLGVLEAQGVDIVAALRGWENVAVPGRLERCDGPEDDVIVLVDYAHTPDALERALAATRPVTSGKLHCIFGCGGDRDPMKRPKMGAAVGRAADVIVVTNDNPRTEEPKRIADAIEVGLKSVGAKYTVELERAKAIETVILSASPGDVVLIAGKGHEPYQIVGKTKYPFDDRVEARRSLGLRRGEKA
jgi:UDP-N-acetylmuramoyl-L-alanyl-D-glutamate--2,6-diaminopimelate ligase